MASLVLGAETPSQSVCVCVAGREGGCWDRQLRVPGPSPQSKEVGPSPWMTENQISPLSLLCRRSSLRLSPCHHLYPPLSLGLLHTSSAPSASQTTAPGTAMLNLAPSETASRPIFHCPPVPGPQPLRERSDPIPLRSNRPAAPAPHLGRAAPGPTGHRLSDRLYSTHCPGTGIYIWLSPPPLACPKKLLESWKRFRRAPWLPEGEKMPKTSPKPPRLPPLSLRAALPAPGSYCPLDRLGWGPCFLEPGHSSTPAPKFCSQGLESASHVVHTSVLWSHIPSATRNFSGLPQ